MRVLLLTPNFWASGTVTFIRELQAGWPAEWPRPVIATATRSGKRSSKWGRSVEQMKRADSTPWEPDVCDNRERLVEYSREFDLVHVNEVETRSSQQEWWYELLERLPVPFTVQLHGNRYAGVDWNRILSCRNFTGVVWQTPGNVPAPLAKTSRVRLVPLPRPWTLKTPVDHPATYRNAYGDRPVIGFHGRFAPDKGVAHVAALGDRWYTCLHGACPAGGYPFVYGLQRQLFGRLHTRAADESWTFTYGVDSVIRYCGPYGDGVDVSRHHAVHVSATREGFSGGTEYTLLEAIDAGCRIVQPLHMLERADSIWSSSPALRTWTYRWEPRGLKSAFTQPLVGLRDAVAAAVSEDSYDASYNRKVVAVRHDPAHLARAFFGVAASRS